MRRGPSNRGMDEEASPSHLHAIGALFRRGLDTHDIAAKLHLRESAVANVLPRALAQERARRKEDVVL